MKYNSHLSPTAVLLLVVTVLCSAFTILHHGWSSYDQNKTLNLEGEILEYGYDNPHGMLKFRTEDKTIWTVVLAPPSRMESRGLAETTLKKAKKAKVVGYPHLTVKGEMRAERITIDGKTTELR